MRINLNCPYEDKDFNGRVKMTSIYSPHDMKKDLEKLDNLIDNMAIQEYEQRLMMEEMVDILILARPEVAEDLQERIDKVLGKVVD
jgi:acetolactate synthase small subunit